MARISVARSCEPWGPTRSVITTRIVTSSNHTPGSKSYSDLVDTRADSVCIHQLVLKPHSKAACGMQAIVSLQYSCKVQSQTVSRFQTENSSATCSFTHAVAFGRIIVVAQHTHCHVRDITTAINEPWQSTGRQKNSELLHWGDFLHDHNGVVWIFVGLSCDLCRFLYITLCFMM